VLLAFGCGSPHEDPPKSGDIVTVIGNGEQATDRVELDSSGAPVGVPALAAHLDSPVDLGFDASGQLFVIDWNGHKIRTLAEDGLLYPVVGSGVEGDACEAVPSPAGCPALSAEVNHPSDITFDSNGRLVIAAWHNSKIKVYDPSSGDVTDACGSGARDYLGDGGPCFGEAGAQLVAFDLPSSVLFDPQGNLLIADQANQVIRRLAVDGTVSTIGGNCPKGGFGCVLGVGYSGDGGPATEAKLDSGIGQAALPAGKLTLDASGNLYFADTFNHVVRRITPGSDGVLGEGDPAEEIIETVVGSGEPGTSGDGGPAREAKLYRPTDVAIAPDGSLYIADRGNFCIRKVDTASNITTVAGECGVPGDRGDGGPATSAWLDEPFGVAIDSQGTLYIADTLNHRIRKVLP
jgi:sugar lactone lactonase YvrE